MEIIFLGGFVVGFLVCVLASRSMCRTCARKLYEKHGPTTDEEVLEKLHREKTERKAE
jgi:hypothetical protein